MNELISALPSRAGDHRNASLRASGTGETANPHRSGLLTRQSDAQKMADFRRLARWRSGYAEDCKATASALKSATFSRIQAVLASRSVERARDRLLTAGPPPQPALRMRQNAPERAVTPLERGVSAIVEREIWDVCDTGAIPSPRL
jgi:hypothetical protein